MKSWEKLDPGSSTNLCTRLVLRAMRVSFGSNQKDSQLGGNHLQLGGGEKRLRCPIGKTLFWNVLRLYNVVYYVRFLCFLLDLRVFLGSAPAVEETEMHGVAMSCSMGVSPCWFNIDAVFHPIQMSFIDFCLVSQKVSSFAFSKQLRVLMVLECTWTSKRMLSEDS